MLKWRKASACAAGADPRACWCEPGREGKCWERSLKTEMVPHILKGGEDSIGYNEAIQRVYFNIGSCAEQCWVNHLTDLRAADPEQRNYGQTPFDIGQCRRDCGSFRAIEDRLDDITRLLPDRAADRPLAGARPRLARATSRSTLDAEFCHGAVERGPRRSSPRTAPAAIRASRGPTRPPTSLRDRPGRPDAAARLARQRRGACRPRRSAPIPARSLHSNHMAEPGLGASTPR